MTAAPPVPTGLAALEARLADELAFLQLPAPRWTPALEHDGQPVVDVAIIGAGMTGLACAAALLQRGVSVVAYDEAPAGLEGPWATTARMETLRSPKQLAGPALGLPSLTFRAWFEAQFGRAAWDALDKIPRLQWMDYLRWYRRGAGAAGAERPSRHRHRCRAPTAWSSCSRSRPTAAPTRAFARRVVARHRPRRPRRAVAARVRRRACRARAGRTRPTTTTTPRCAGLRVGVVGAGASAMDSAATALEAGAAHVHLLVRRADLPRINKGKGAGNPGFVRGLRAPARRLEMAHPPLHQHAAGAAAAQQHAARLAPRERALPPRRRDRGRRRARRRAAGAHVGRADRARLPDLRHRLHPDGVPLVAREATQ